MKKPWFHILLALAEGPTHGAEVRRRAQDRTAGETKLYPVTLYRSLDELVDRGLLEELPEPADADHNERRRYFALTPEGRKALREEAKALEAEARLAWEALASGGPGE
ncbi:MAG TPA: helix-turn-helix transcriptional regulator [Longimicrobiales bacterium]|nr:helix-turn-helix transcriptional regulator [Longimicrobiales bacterium]